MADETETMVDMLGADGSRSVAYERFVREGQLGEGGMAVVYRARDSETGQPVALKLLTGNLDAAARTRFQREVKAASKIEHENICRVVAVGEHDGQPFLAMELVEGETLGALAKRGPEPMPAKIAATLLAQLCEALAQAHAAGVLHRDLKPANVMVTPEGVVKLLDFGIAKSVDDETVTKTGALVGTPAFMAPEQVKQDKVDHKVDLFAAGLTLFSVLRRNRHRFANKKLDPTQMLIRVALEPTAPLLEEVPAAPVALDNVLAGMTALNPANRFADARAARAALLESGLVDPDAHAQHALIARYVQNPAAAAAELDGALARQEAAFADDVMKREGGVWSAALALHRASLLDPGGPHAATLEKLCAENRLSFAPVTDERTEALRLQIHAEPQSAALIKKMSDVMKGKGQVRLHAAYLWRYVRERPNDTLALMQLRTLLDGPLAADEEAAAKSAVRLSTRSIVAGIKTGGLQLSHRIDQHIEARDRAARADENATHSSQAPRSVSLSAAQRPLTKRKTASERLLEDDSARAAPGGFSGGAPQRAVVFADGGAAPGEGKSRTVLAAAVVGLVVLGGIAVASALGGGGKPAVVVKNDDAQLAEAEQLLLTAPDRAAAAASAVIDGAPEKKIGLQALWVRARAHRAMGNKSAARADCDLYLARATDFHDPNLLAVKALRTELGSTAP